MSNPNRRGALALVSASMCLVLAALFSLGEPASPALSAAGEAAVPAAADWGLSFPTEGESPVGNATAEDLARYGAYYLGTPARRSSISPLTAGTRTATRRPFWTR